MASKVERVTDIPLLSLGEGPHWDIETQSLYFVDIFGKSIHRYVPSTGQYTSVQLEKQYHIIIPLKGKKNQFVISTEKDINIITWDGVSDKLSKIETIASPEEGTSNGLNDGKCDPKGRLWIGSGGSPLDTVELKLSKTGSLFSIDNKLKLCRHVTEIEASNGMAWNTKLKEFYYIDTMKGTVDVFDCNIEKGTISNRRTLFSVSKHSKGIPDGMTIDTDGNLWVAAFGGYSVIKIDPRKPETVLQTVKMPVKQITSVAWGGKDLDELYVTSANIEFKKGEPHPDNGAVFKVTNLGTKGLPMENFVF